MPEMRRPRGVTQHPRSGAAAESARLGQHRNGGEELPHVGGQGGNRVELSRVRGQGRRVGGATPPPRSGGCMGAGGPRGSIPRSRSEGAAMRRYPLSKVKETQGRQ